MFLTALFSESEEITLFDLSKFQEENGMQILIMKESAHQRLLQVTFKVCYVL